MFNLFLSVQVSPNDIVRLHECVQLSLEILVLLGQKGRVLLKGLGFSLEIQVSVHTRLIGVVHCLQVSILPSFFNL
jgi:hypothetical protein